MANIDKEAKEVEEEHPLKQVSPRYIGWFQSLF